MNNTRCERCFKDSIALSMSWLNQDMLCLDCKEKEKSHPQYEEAKRVELEQVKNGNYNYPGLLNNKPL